jgi:hypothetical protein
MKSDLDKTVTKNQYRLQAQLKHVQRTAIREHSDRSMLISDIFHQCYSKTGSRHMGFFDLDRFRNQQEREDGNGLCQEDRPGPDTVKMSRISNTIGSDPASEQPGPFVALLV